MLWYKNQKQSLRPIQRRNINIGLVHPTNFSTPISKNNGDRKVAVILFYSED